MIAWHNYAIFNKKCHSNVTNDPSKEIAKAIASWGLQWTLSYAATQKEDQILVFKTDYRLMQVKKYWRGAFCNTFDLH